MLAQRLGVACARAGTVPPATSTKRVYWCSAGGDNDNRSVVAGWSHIWWTPIILPDRLHDSRRPHCRHQPHIDQQHKSNAITRSAPPHPTGNGMAPPSLKVLPDPYRHGLGATGKESCGHAVTDKRTRVIPHKGPPALGWHVKQLLENSS
jgi:hypothetical protein